MTSHQVQVAGASGRPTIEIVRGMIFERMEELGKVLPKSMDRERFVRSTLIALSKSPNVLACTPNSILRCLLEAASEGLEPTGLFGGAWLVPFGNVCTLIRSYVGLCKLVRRSGEIASIEARVIRDGDMIELEYGLEQRFRHVPSIPPRGEIVGAYSMVRLLNGAVSVEMMARDEIEKVRAVSKARNSGPWKDWYEEMARKTVLRRHCKYLPLDDLAVQAIQADDESTGAGFASIVEAPGTPAERLRARAVVAPPVEETKEGGEEHAEQEQGGPEAEPDHGSERPAQEVAARSRGTGNAAARAHPAGPRRSQ